MASLYNDYLMCVGKKGEKLISILDLSIILTDSELEELDAKDKDETNGEIKTDSTNIKREKDGEV